MGNGEGRKLESLITRINANEERGFGPGGRRIVNILNLLCIPIRGYSRQSRFEIHRQSLRTLC